MENHRNQPLPGIIGIAFWKAPLGWLSEPTSNDSLPLDGEKCRGSEFLDFKSQVCWLISQFFTCVADESPVFLMAVVPTVVFFKCRRSPTAPRAPRAPRRKAWYCLVGFSNGTSAEGAQVVSLAVKKKNDYRMAPPSYKLVYKPW